MKKLRVLALFHDNLVPPESIEGLSDEEVAPYKMEFDVREALRELGHEVRVLGVGDELLPIRQAIEEFQPHVAFNALTHFLGVATYDAYAVSYLELLRTPYTGCNPRGILLAGDKALSKKILAYHRIPVPAFAVFRYGRRIRAKPKRLDYPLIVKSAVEHSSIGIAQASVVHDDKALAERVEFIHRNFSTDAIAEQYIEGRELTVGILGNERLQAFPVQELDFGKMTETGEPIATARLKWDKKYQERMQVTCRRAGLEPKVEEAIGRMGKRIFRVLGMSGYARVDLRMSADGKVYVLEANPNPDLSYGEDFAESALQAGIRYPMLVQRILKAGIGYQPAWK